VELDALKDLGPDEREPLIERAKAGEQVSARRPRNVDRINIGLSDLAIRVENCLSAAGLTPYDFGREIGERGAEILTGLRQGRQIGFLIEAKINSFLERRSKGVKQTEQLRTPSANELAERDARLNAWIEAEAMRRRISLRDMLIDLVRHGAKYYAEERGLEL
jgi:hypothetical protein